MHWRSCPLPAATPMTFELDIWREVSRHDDIETFVERVAPLLMRRYRWVQGIAILVVSDEDRSSRCLTAVGAQANSWRFPVARDLPIEALEAYDAWQDGRQIVAWHQVPPALRQLLGAVGGERPFAMIPLADDDGAEGLAILTGTTVSPPVNLKQLHPLREPFALAIRNNTRMRELQRLRAAAEADRSALLRRLSRDTIDESIIGADAGLRDVMEHVEQVARGTAPVLLLGETGAGKEIIARSIHDRSPRANGPMVRVNCGAIPAELIDSELFGHAKGSFTGAVSDRMGWFERADGGTLLLDEVGELPLAAQVRLLRVLQDGTFHRVGGEKQLRCDVRIVAATHRDLPSMVRSGAFREDLWYRLSIFPIHLPPLRDRRKDIGSLAQYFADRAGRRLGGAPLVLSAEDIALLQTYDWPGNARELAAVIERAAIIGNGRRLAVPAALGMSLATRTGGETTRAQTAAAAAARTTATPTSLAHADASAAPSVPSSNARRWGSLDDAIVDKIHDALRRTGGTVEGRHGAAAILGVNPSTLRSRMKKLSIRWEDYRQSEIDEAARAASADPSSSRLDVAPGTRFGG